MVYNLAMTHHLSRADQLIFGIEFAALAYQYLICPRQTGSVVKRRRRASEVAPIHSSKAKPDNGDWNTLELAEFVRELHGDVNDREPGSSERLFRNYLKLLASIAPGLECNIQSGYFQNFNTANTQLRLCVQYFRVFAQENVRNEIPSDVSDSAFRKYIYTIGAMNKQQGRSEYTRALFHLVFLHFAIQHRLRVRISISTQERLSYAEIIPVSLFCSGGTLTLCFLDPRSKKYEMLPLSEIASIESDLYHSYMNRSNYEVDFKIVRHMVRSAQHHAVCEIPLNHLIHCLSRLPDFVGLQYSDHGSARVTLSGSNDALRSALIYVLPYATSIEPPGLLDEVRSHLSELSLRLPIL